MIEKCLLCIVLYFVDTIKDFGGFHLLFFVPGSSGKLNGFFQFSDSRFEILLLEMDIRQSNQAFRNIEGNVGFPTYVQGILQKNKCRILPIQLSITIPKLIKMLGAYRLADRIFQGKRLLQKLEGFPVFPFQPGYVAFFIEQVGL